MSNEQLVAAINNALFKSKTKEKDIINIILQTDEDRRVELAELYNKTYNKKLEEDLKKKLSRDFEDLVVGLFQRPEVYAAEQLVKALKSPVDEEAIYEIICTRPMWLLEKINREFGLIANDTLFEKMHDKLSKSVGKCIAECFMSKRSENKNPDHHIAEQNADLLLSKKGDEWLEPELFKKIFAKSSPEEIVLMMRYYNQKCGVNLITDIENKMKKDNRIFLRYYLYGVISPSELFAEIIRKAFKGAGTNDKVFIRALISRNEIDMDLIRQFYLQNYNLNLEDDIKSETSGPYQELAVALSRR